MEILITKNQYSVLVNESKNIVFGNINEIRRKVTTDEFIKKAQMIHQNPDGTPKYNYDNTIYDNAISKVEIICPKHGSFFQTPNNHLSGQGCPKCGGNKHKTTDEFIKDAQKVHQNPDGTPKYGYDNANYVNNITKVEITCPKHGEFLQSPGDHLSGKGCQICGIESRSKLRTKTTDEFIKQAQMVHQNPDGTPKYDYSNTNYVKAMEKVEINCPKHGTFLQIPNDHLRGKGCPRCRESVGEKLIHNYLSQQQGYDVVSQKEFEDCTNIHKNKRWCTLYKFDIYLPEFNTIIEFDGEQHFKKTFFHKTDEYYNEKVEDDRYKINYCKDNNIKLIRISYNEKDVIGQLIKGLKSNKKIWLSDNYPKEGWNKKVLRMSEGNLIKLTERAINEQKSGPDYINFINNLSTVDPNIFNTKKPLEYLQNKLTEYKSKNPGINLDMKTLVQQLLSPTSPFKFTTFKIQTYEPKRVSTMDVNLKNIGFTLSKSDIDPMTIQGGVKLKF
jgi:Zn finger protein HypA/HybF involved in hydrogenase expression